MDNYITIDEIKRLEKHVYGKEYKKHKHLKISAELHAEIKKEAKQNGMFIDAFLRKALEDHRKQKMLRELRGL